MDVVFSVCIGRVELHVLVYWKYDCFVMQMLNVCVLCGSCGSSQFCVMHELQCVYAGRRCKRPPYIKGILQSRSHDSLIVCHECRLLFTPSCCCECFYHLYICSGLCACTGML